MKRIVSAAILLLCCCSVSYATSVDYPLVKKMAAEIEGIYVAGTAIPTKYDIKNISDFRKCAEEYRPIRNRGRELMAEARDLNSIRYRLELTRAADAAFVCVYCDGNGTKCLEVEKQLQTIKEMLNEDEY